MRTVEPSERACQRVDLHVANIGSRRRQTVAGETEKEARVRFARAEK